MGYFSNGTESDDYEAKYCSKCAHQYGPDGNRCVVWLAHLFRNYDECNNPDSILHMLIPRSHDGLGNEKCYMFIAKADRDAEAAWNRRASPPTGVHSAEPWGWLCNGKGDGWEERDKVVRDPGLIARYRERPDLWRIEPLYLGSPPAAVPDGWRDALEHVTELLVDTWHHQMDGDPEEQIAVKDARALLATLPLSVPEGWVLVPKEPTPEMLDAATPPESDWIGQKWAKPGSIERWRQCHREDAERKYRSMISAAPTPPVEDGSKTVKQRAWEIADQLWLDTDEKSKLARLICDAFSASPTPPVDDGWRPIETAPKDGTRFWGKIGDDAIAMLWHPKFNAFVSAWRRMTMVKGYMIDGDASLDHSPIIEHPEAWMPLPAPPKVKEE